MNDVHNFHTHKSNKNDHLMLLDETNYIQVYFHNLIIKFILTLFLINNLF